jgi:Flp pilus assembly protein TadD
MTDRNRRVISWLAPCSVLVFLSCLVFFGQVSWFNPPEPTLAGFRALEDGRIVDAIHRFSQAKKYCETDIEASCLLGISYQEYGWGDEALEEYGNTWKLAARNVGRAMWNAARLLREKGENENAVLHYRRALLFMPESHEIWYELGSVLEEMRQKASATAAYQEALRLNPQNRFYQQTVERIFVSEAPERQTE